MYGESIKQMILEMCKFFGLKDAKILLEDNGALPFVLAARFELAVKRLFPFKGKFKRERIFASFQ
jgi:citrate lyase subunit beta / citryl-CoA lyase